jgi:PAS domain S-box-containing protein
LIAELLEGKKSMKQSSRNPSSAITFAMEGKFYAMNPIAAAYTGYAMDELIGRPSDFMIHPEDRQEVKEKARAMLRGAETFPYEFRILTRSQEIRWVMEVVAPILLSGKPAILGNAMDITKPKLMEQKLRESENLYRTIFETTGTMTTIADERKVIILVNSEWERMTGYRKEDWEGKKTWMDCVDQRDLPRMLEYHRQRRIDPQSVPGTYECRLIDSQGRIRNVLTTVNLIPGTGNNVSSAMDITERKEAEKELIRKSENLAELNTALKVLLKQREADREALETTLLSNVRDLVLPYIEKIRQGDLDPKARLYLDLITSNLENILSPFSRTLAAMYRNLTAKEIEVANYIKAGKSSKEIATLLNISRVCVDVHRYHIRAKLGLKNKKVNLRAYLASLP